LEKENDIKDSFDSIERASDRIVRTIDLILNMSEVQAGSYECIFKQIDINSILERIYPEFSYKAAKKNIELSLNTNSKKLIVTADEYSLVQIFVNIIDNAIKYTNEGKVEIKSFINSDNKISVAVSDTGIGISEDYLTHIFTPFFQEEQGYGRRYDGNGLGLALVKKYSEMNNAEIIVESKKGIGTTFTVIFESS
jgi:signal transduction histidine kinase